MSSQSVTHHTLQLTVFKLTFHSKVASIVKSLTEIFSSTNIGAMS